jgi:signal peptidase II
MHLKKHIWCSVMIVLIVAFDQVTKLLAKKYLLGNAAVPFIKGVVQFNYAENQGMAFSMFGGARWVFVALTSVVCIGALVLMFKNKIPSLWAYWSIGVIVAGGIGNLIDRILYGYVVDFIEPTFMNFAIFIIADSAVTLGTISLMIYLVLDIFKKDEKPAEESDD